MHTSGLQRRFTVLIVLIFSVVCLIAFGVWNLFTSQIIQRLGVNYAVRTVNWHTEKTQSLLEREVALAQKLADSPLLREWCSNESNPRLTHQALSELNSYRNLFKDKSYFFIVNRSRHYYYNDMHDKYQGKELQYTLNPRLFDDQWYFNTLRHVDQFALNVDHDVHLNTTKAWINVIVRDGSRKVGVAGTGIDMTDFIKSLLNNSDKAATTILFDKQGAITAYKNTRYVTHNSNGHNVKPITIFNLLPSVKDRAYLKSILKNASAHPGTPQTCELTVEGHKYLAAVAYMPRINWYDLVLIKTDALFSHRLFIPILGVMFGAMLIVILCTAFFVQRFVLIPLSRLTVSAQKIANGRYDVQLPENRSDEIGLLTQTFNQMSSTVKAYTENLEHLVAERTEDLQQANDLLESTNKQITDSIAYATVIQKGVLPPKEILDAYFTEQFAIWKPRDIVGGDAYFAHEVGDHLFFALVDCTGHGVSGALMTMSASALLMNHIADPKYNSDPAAILQGVNQSIRTMLGQDARDQAVPTGMEMGLCCYRPKEKQLIYAGARISLWVRDSKGLHEIHGDRQSLGYVDSAEDTVYINHVLSIENRLSCYMTTDGWLDQSGAQTAGRGFGRKAFHEMLEKTEQLPMDEQALRYEEHLRLFQGDTPQRDDITLVGFLLTDTPGKKPAGS